MDMAPQFGIRGVLPIIPTIFDHSGAIDERGVVAVVEYIISAGADGVVFPGLASEYDMLSEAERLFLTKRIGALVDGRVKFIVGATADTPESAIVYAQAGADAGACAAMILTPHAFADDLPAMSDFYAKVGRVSGIPIMLQNAPRPMGIGLDLHAVAQIAKDVTNIRYVKEEAAPSGQRITKLTALAGDTLDAVFGGAGARYVIDELKRGALGTMPACEITEVHVAMLRLFKTGNEDAARDLFERTLPLLNVQANFRWHLTKNILVRRGLIDHPFVRAAGPGLDSHDLAEIDFLLNRLSDIVTL